MRFSPVLAGVALWLASSSVLAQHLEPELGVVPPESESTYVAVVAHAAAGTEHVVVYTNQTASSVTSRFVVLGSDGAILRAPDVSLPLATGTLSCRGTDCALIGTERPSIVGTATTNTNGVFVVRFRTDGTVVDPSPLALVEALAPTDSFTSLVHAPTSTGYLVMWDQSVGSSHTRISMPVLLTGPPGASVTHGAGGMARLACHAASCLLLDINQWSSSTGFYRTTLQRISATGTPLATPVELTTTHTDMLVADTGVDFIVADTRWSSGPRWRVAYDGTLTTLPASVPNANGAACDGAGGCLILGGSLRWWRADDTIVAGPTTSLSSAHCVAPGVCLGLGRYTRLVHPITFDGTTITVGTGTELRVPTAHPHGAPLVTAHDGASHLVLFRDTVGSALTAARIDSAAPATTGGTATGITPSADARVVLQRGSSRYVLLSRNGSTLELRLLDDAGMSAFGPVALGPSSTAMGVAWNGMHYLVAWGTSTELRVQRLDAIGQRVDDAPRVVRTGSFQSVDVAWDGAHWLLVTREGNVRVKAMRLEEDGTPIDAPTGVLVRDANGTGAHVAFGRGTYLAVWQDLLAAGGAEIRAARITTGGEVLDLGGDVVATVPRPVSAFDLVYDGSRFVVGWSFVDDSSTTAPARIVIRARTIAIDGAMGSVVDVLDEPDRGYRAYSAAAPAPALAIGSAELGRTLITYTRQMSSLAEAPVRLRMRTFVDDSLGAGCTTGADCAGGVCSDGICCDRACDGACEACGFDGHCALAEPGTICRDAAGTCDAPEVCDGSAATCPVATIEDCDGGVIVIPDAGVPDGTDGGGIAPDAGWEADAAVADDAGSTGDLDGGVVGPDAGAPSDGGGGGCSTSGAGAANGGTSVLMLLAVLALVVRRRAIR